MPHAEAVSKPDADVKQRGAALLPGVSVVIPTLGRDRRLLDTVRNLAEQDLPAWECLVISQGDKPDELASQLHELLPGRLRFFHLCEASASLARNVGILEASFEVLLFIDDDVEIPSIRFLFNHARHYVDHSVSGVVGQVLAPDKKVRNDRHWLSRSERNGWMYFPTNFSGTARVRNGRSVNLSVRRQWAFEVGGMDANFEKGAHREESDFCLRYTDRFGPLVFDPEATLIHLGEQVGGCRNWGADTGVRPLHHVVGEWYFIFRGLKCGTIRITDIPHHAHALVRRQLMNRANLSSATQLFHATRRCLKGAVVAMNQTRACPRHIGSVDPSSYSEI